MTRRSGRQKWWPYILLLIVLVLAGCAVQPVPVPTAIVVTATPWASNTPSPPVGATETPTQETDFPGPGDKESLLPGEGFVILNENPLLEFLDPVRTERYENGVLVGWAEQCQPRGYTVVNRYETLDGQSGEGDHTRLTEVFADGLGCRADISVYAGETGIATVFAVDQPGCHILKGAGSYSIQDAAFADHPYNYGFKAELRSATGDRKIIFDRLTVPDLVGDWVDFWPVWIGAAGRYEARFLVSVAYATAEPASDQFPLGSWMRMGLFAVAYDADGDHCDRPNVPGI